MLAIAKMDYSQYTNVPVGVIQFIDGSFKKKTSTGWEPLPITYITDVIQATTATISGSITAGSVSTTSLTSTSATISGSLTSQNISASGNLLISSNGVIHTLGTTNLNVINELSAVGGNFTGNISSPTIEAINTSITNETTRATAAEAALTTSITSVDNRVTTTEQNTATQIASVRYDFAAADVGSVSTAKSYTDTQLASLVNSAPSTLDTLKELATALGNDANFSTTVSSPIGSLQTQLNVLVPPGVITAYLGATAPTGWLLCDGNIVSRSTYSALFAVISTTYGVGNGSTTFGLPNLKQKFLLGKSDSGTGSTLGGTGGSIDLPHRHAGPSHNHIVNSHSHTSGSLRAAIGVRLDDAGGGVRMSLDGNNTFTPGFRWYASGVGFPADSSPAPSTVVFGSTDTDSPATNYAGTGDTGQNSTLNPPFLAVNYIIKT
jgi:microcystin-dependent protein